MSVRVFYDEYTKHFDVALDIPFAKRGENSKDYMIRVIQMTGEKIKNEIVSMENKSHLICFAANCQKKATSHTVKMGLYIDDKTSVPYLLSGLFCDDTVCKKQVVNALLDMITCHIDKNNDDINICNFGSIINCE